MREVSGLPETLNRHTKNSVLPWLAWVAGGLQPGNCKTQSSPTSEATDAKHALSVSERSGNEDGSQKHAQFVLCLKNADGCNAQFSLEARFPRSTPDLCAIYLATLRRCRANAARDGHCLDGNYEFLVRGTLHELSF